MWLNLKGSLKQAIQRANEAAIQEGMAGLAKAARTMGMATVGFAGRDGGSMPPLCDHVFVVQSFSIHRVQEAHLALLHVLWDMVHVVRGEEDVVG